MYVIHDAQTLLDHTCMSFPCAARANENESMITHFRYDIKKPSSPRWAKKRK